MDQCDRGKNGVDVPRIEAFLERYEYCSCTPLTEEKVLEDEVTAGWGRCVSTIAPHFPLLVVPGGTPSEGFYATAFCVFYMEVAVSKEKSNLRKAAYRAWNGYIGR